jgi:hypothetical protein
LLQNTRRQWTPSTTTKKKKQEQRHDESSLIEQVFGAGACLYATVLGCSSSGPTVSAALGLSACLQREALAQAICYSRHDWGAGLEAVAAKQRVIFEPYSSP